MPTSVLRAEGDTTVALLQTGAVVKQHSSSSDRLAQGASAEASLEASGGARSRISGAPLVDQHLVICNAYASDSPLEILHVDQQRPLTSDRALNYKECREFTLPLMEGDRLDFKAGGHNVGTFHATSMPKAAASLLLVPRGRDRFTRSLAFESHAFADLKNPQIAVVDAFRGNATGSLHIKENLKAAAPPGRAAMEEALRFNSVVAVAAGDYHVGLAETESSGALTALPLRASPRAKCVVMRVGGGYHQGVAFPQELVVFSNWAAARLTPLWMAAVAAFLAFASTY